MHAYVWDRYYGICLAKYQHTDVVNSVAFNPRDSEMLVTTSDDYTIKVPFSSRPMNKFNWLPNEHSFKIMHFLVDMEIDGTLS